MKNPQLLILRIRDYINIKVQKSIKKKNEMENYLQTIHFFIY